MSGIFIIAVIYLWMRVNKLKTTLDIQNNKIQDMHTLLNDLKQKIYPEDIITKVEPEIKESITIEKTDETEDLTDFKVKHTVKESKPTPKIKLSGILKKELFSVESIITKLGILFLLISVGFIFKLAYDNGYITEELALLFGAAIGFIIGFLGLHVRNRGRLLLSQVLFGGSVATLFITTYAAYQGYGIITSLSAFALMAIIACAAFVVSISINSVAMSIVGVVGGLLTPFIVELDYLGLNGLGLYILSLSIVSASIYLFKKWRALQISSILGIISVTSYLATFDLAVKETYQLGILIAVLLVIFNGVDYMLYYKNEEAPLSDIISPLLFGLLPIISLIQLNAILNLSNNTQSLIYIGAAIIYATLTLVIYTKRGHGTTSNITLSFVALFTLFSDLLYFGGDIRYMSVIVMSLVFYYVAYKTKNPFAGIIGHILYVLGFLIAYNGLIIDTINGPASGMDVLSRLVILVLLTIGILIQKKPIRYVFGIMVYEIYAVLLIEILLFQWTKNTEQLAIMILAYGIWLWILLLLSKKASFIPKQSIVIVGIVPVFLKFVLVFLAVDSWEFNGPEVSALIAYSVLLYAMANYQLKDIKTLYRFIAKISSFIIISLTCIIDIWVLTDHFGYALFSYGALVLLINYFESDLEYKTMKILLLVMKINWLIIGAYYVLFGIDNVSFEMVPFVFDLLILGILYAVIRTFELKTSYQFIIHLIVYMIIIYQNFEYAVNGDGTTTLLWAAYAIVSLTYSVIKVKRDIVNISLIMIVAIAVKFVVVDISTVSILWKIITSMAFGVALLVLSYILQPILARNEKVRRGGKDELE